MINLGGIGNEEIIWRSSCVGEAHFPPPPPSRSMEIISNLIRRGWMTDTSPRMYTSATVKQLYRQSPIQRQFSRLFNAPMIYVGPVKLSKFGIGLAWDREGGSSVRNGTKCDLKFIMLCVGGDMLKNMDIKRNLFVRNGKFFNAFLTKTVFWPQQLTLQFVWGFELCCGTQPSPVQNNDDLLFGRCG